jgi:hypothetical protein
MVISTRSLRLSHPLSPSLSLSHPPLPPSPSIHPSPASFISELSSVNQERARSDKQWPLNFPKQSELDKTRLLSEILNSEVVIATFIVQTT